MKSVYDFIVEPLGETYDNEIKVEEKNLILNTKIESFKFVNRLARVIETPLAFTTPIKKGDKIAHLNVYVEDELETKIDLFAAEDVERSNIFSRLLTLVNYG